MIASAAEDAAPPGTLHARSRSGGALPGRRGTIRSMWLFHGTRLDTAGERSLRREGLRGTAGGWAATLLGERPLCFLSPEPVAGVGGDPVSFALGWPWRHRHTR